MARAVIGSISVSPRLFSLTGAATAEALDQHRRALLSACGGAKRRHLRKPCINLLTCTEARIDELAVLAAY